MSDEPPLGPGRGQSQAGDSVGRGVSPAPRGRAALLKLAARRASSTTGASGDAAPAGIPSSGPPPATAGRGRAMLLAKIKAAKEKSQEVAGAEGSPPTSSAPAVAPTKRPEPPSKPPPSASSALAARLQKMRMARPTPPPSTADASFATATSEVESKTPSPPTVPSKTPSPPTVPTNTPSPPTVAPKASPPAVGARPPPPKPISPIPKASPPQIMSRPATPAAPSGSRSTTPVVSSGSAVSSSSPPPPDSSHIPQHYRGSGGKPINVTANYLKLHVKPGCGVFEHEVLFEPRVDSREERYRLIGQQTQVIGYTRVFDGAKLYLPMPLPDGKKDLTSVDTRTGQDVKVTIIFKKERDAGDRDLIYLYNNLVNKIMRTLKLVQHNRNFFDPKMAHHIPQYNLDVWPGYCTAVDRFEDGLLLQLDAANRVLRTETVRDLLQGIYRRLGQGGSLKQEAEKQLLGSSVLTRYNNKSYIIDDLDFDSSPKSTFTDEKGQTMTFMDYYHGKYGLTIRDPDQPLLIHRPRKKNQNEADVNTIICLVPELCLLTGLTDAMRADFKIMKEVGNFTRLTPAKRQEVLHKFVQTIENTPEAKAHLTDWGLKLSPTTVPLEARQLQPEVLHFGRGYKETVTPKADWTRAATSKHVLTSVPLTKWAIVFMQKNQPIVKNFCTLFQQQGPRMGINVSAPKVIGLPNDRTETYLKAVREIIDPSVQLVVTIFPQMRSDRYAAIKKLCIVEKPVATQVVNLKTISNEKKVASVVQKIALQINCKLGGELWGCSTPYQGLMVVGIDVYHDKTRKGSSVAGVVVSLNDSLSRYFSKAVFQQDGQEIMDALKVAFIEGMIKFWEVNHHFPRHIVVFRDGVGDGQLEVADKHEAEQFIRAFTHVKNGSGTKTKLEEVLPPDYSPGFTFVVVQKRINTRIYSCCPRGPKMDFENPPPGTVLDHTVTRYKYKDFFLVPQSVNQGTVSPTHFIVLRELGAEAQRSHGKISTFDASDVQKLAYKLTHMYFNWPGTVRVPSPVQYAHKLVDLVGQHVHKVPSPLLDDKLYYL